jgi:hypothetical protein
MRVLSGVLAVTAVTTFTPAWTYVPAPLRATLAAQQGGTLYLPARTPLFYRYRSGAGVRAGFLTVTFTNRVRVHQGLWRWTNQKFVWQVRSLAARADCRNWGNARKTLQMSGNKVYSAPGVAWRCVTDKRGHRHVLAAIDGTGRLPDTGLGFVVASGLDVSGR